MSSRVARTPPGSDYLIAVRDREFLLMDSELRSEPGNALIEPLTRGEIVSRGQQPGHLRKISVHTDPSIFGLIHAHLTGLEIFPLSSQGIPLSTTATPLYLGKEATLKNLLRDAEDFGMMNLCGKIRREMAGQIGSNSEETQFRPEPEGTIIESPREVEYRLAMNLGRWTHWNEKTARGTPISQTTKEAILLKLINSDIELVETYMPVPKGYRFLAAWDEYPSSGDRSSNTKSFVLLEST